MFVLSTERACAFFIELVSLRWAFNEDATIYAAGCWSALARPGPARHNKQLTLAIEGPNYCQMTTDAGATVPTVAQG